MRSTKPVKLQRQLLKETDKTCKDGVPSRVDNEVIAHYSKETDKLELFFNDEFLNQLLENKSTEVFSDEKIISNYKLGDIACNEIPSAMIAALTKSSGIYGSEKLDSVQKLDNEPFIATISSDHIDGCQYFQSDNVQDTFTMFPTARMLNAAGDGVVPNAAMWSVISEEVVEK